MDSRDPNSAFKTKVRRYTNENAKEIDQHLDGKAQRTPFPEGVTSSNSSSPEEGNVIDAHSIFPRTSMELPPNPAPDTQRPAQDDGGNQLREENPTVLPSDERISSAGSSKSQQPGGNNLKSEGGTLLKKMGPLYE